MGNWIVIVDDEALSLTSARNLLAQEDMKISCLRSGRELLAFLEKNSPDLILLDVMMPEMSGFETLTALREKEKEMNRPETPVIFLTGEADDETERRGLGLGAADYIHKPFNKDILTSRIGNTIKYSKRIESLTEDATIDGLTGFLNKTEGIARISDALLTMSGALLVLDLDSFKLVNDLYGHKKGDLILAAFADIARVSTREGDILCRIGGDEFLAFCCDLSGEASLSALTDRLNRRLEEQAQQIIGADHGIPLGISVGAVMVPEYGRDYDTLFKMADDSMYRTKHNGKHGCTLYAGSEAFSEPVHDPDEELERLTKIISERNCCRETPILGVDAFSVIYHFVERFNARYGGKAMELLFIVTPKNTGDETMLKEAVASFGKILRNSLRKSDVITQNRSNRFFVLLPVMQEPDEEGVLKRIMSGWEGMPESNDFEIKTAYKIR